MGIEIWKDCDHSVIASNVIRNVSTMGISVAGSDYVSVVGNTIENQGTYGIELAASDHCTVSGNVVNGGTHGMSLSNNNDPYDVKFNTICGNTFVNCSKFGIQLYNDASGTTISGNTIQNISGDTPGRGIMLNTSGDPGTMYDVAIVGNNIFNTDGAGIWISGGAYYTLVDGNNVRTCNAAGNDGSTLVDGGTSTLLGDNIT